MRALRLVSLLVLLPAALPAQGNPRMTGLTAGFNLSRFGGEDVSDVETDGRVGLAVGVFGSFRLSDMFAFQPEILFIQKGADFTADNGTGGSFKLDYMQIPLLGRIRFSTEGKAVPFVMLGPSIAFRIGCYAAIVTPGGSVGQECDAISTSGVASTDFSLIGGAGVEISNLFLSVRYDYSLTQLNLLPDAQKVYNRGFAIMAAYGFRSW